MVNLDTLEAFDAGNEVDPGDAAGPGPRGQAGPGQGARPGRAHEGAHRAGPRLLPERRRRPSRPPVAGSRSCPPRGVTGARPPRATRSPTGRAPAERPVNDRVLPAPAPYEEVAPPMLSRLRNMFRVPDLRNKILFTILIVAVYRFGTHIPVPYVDFARSRSCRTSPNNGGVVGFLDLFSGGAITNVVGLLPRDHAVHHGVDHHAAARGRHPEARAVAERGPGRAEEDHPVDPLPHRRPRADAVDRASCSRCTRASSGLLGLRRLPGPRPDPRLQRRRAPRSSSSRGRPAPRW